VPSRQVEPLLAVNAHVNVFGVHIKDNPALRIIKRPTKTNAYRSKAHVSRVLAIAAMLCCGVIGARATTIVVVYTPKDVSIAADSVGTFETGPKSVCKIYRMGNVFLGVAGIDNDPVTKFRISEIVFRASRGVQRFDDKIVAAARAINSNLLAEARNLKVTRLRDFSRITNPETGGVTIILVGIQDGAPFAIGQHFGVSLGSKRDIKVAPGKSKQCPGVECPSGVTYTFRLGVVGAIEKYLSVPHPQITDSAESARQLAQLEIDDHAAGVGGPIDVIRLTTKGVQWVQQKPGCPIELGLDRPTTTPRRKPAPQR
jgi:hypothetical protein